MHIFHVTAAPKERKAPKERAASEIPLSNCKADATALEASSSSCEVGTLSETTDNSQPRSPPQEEPAEMSDSFQVSDAVAECPQPVQDADKREQAGAPSETQTASSYSAELKKQLADITRKYTELQEHHATARNFVKGLKNQVQRLESEMRNFSKTSSS